MSKLRVSIAGLGTVGRGVAKLFADGASRLNEKMQLVAVSARNAGQDRGVDLGGYRWYDDPVAVASDTSVDVFVELIGGADSGMRDTRQGS